MVGLLGVRACVLWRGVRVYGMIMPSAAAMGKRDSSAADRNVCVLGVPVWDVPRSSWDDGTLERRWFC